MKKLEIYLTLVTASPLSRTSFPSSILIKPRNCNGSPCAVTSFSPWRWHTARARPHAARRRTPHAAGSASSALSATRVSTDSALFWLRLGQPADRPGRLATQPGGWQHAGSPSRQPDGVFGRRLTAKGKGGGGRGRAMLACEPTGRRSKWPTDGGWDGSFSRREICSRR